MSNLKKNHYYYVFTIYNIMEIILQLHLMICNRYNTKKKRKSLCLKPLKSIEIFLSTKNRQRPTQPITNVLKILSSIFTSEFHHLRSPCFSDFNILIFLIKEKLSTKKKKKQTFFNEGVSSYGMPFYVSSSQSLLTFS